MRADREKTIDGIRYDGIGSYESTKVTLGLFYQEDADELSITTKNGKEDICVPIKEVVEVLKKWHYVTE